MLEQMLISGHTLSRDEYDLRLKYTLFNLLLLFNIIFIGLAAIARFVNHQPLNGWIDLVYVSLALLTFFLARRSKKAIYPLMTFVIVFSYVIITVIFYASASILTGTSWYILLVIVSFIFKGRNTTIAVFLISFLTIMGIALMHHHLPVRDILIGSLPYVSIVYFLSIFDQHNAKLRKDIEQQKAEYAHLSRHDSLTGIPNRTLFFEHLDEMFEKTQTTGEPFALLFVDLDGFKNINDRYGHQTGDAILIAVSKRLKQILRQSDLLSRIGGDEFALILTQCDNMEHLRQILGRLLETTDSPVHVDNRSIRVSLSIGVALAPRSGTERTILLRHADEAMYAAKRREGTAFSFYEDIKASLTH